MKKFFKGLGIFLLVLAVLFFNLFFSFLISSDDNVANEFFTLLLLWIVGIVIYAILKKKKTTTETHTDISESQPKNRKKEDFKMAKCNSCGKFGFTLKLNTQGICAECEAKAKVESLSQKLEEMMSPEQRNLEHIKNETSLLERQLNSYKQEIAQLDAQLKTKTAEISSLDNIISTKNQDIVKINDVKFFQDFGIYEPDFDFLKIDEYKEKLSKLRDRQKTMVKNGTAVTGVTSWTVNGSAAQGKKMVADTQKLLLRAFNGECDELVAKVKYNNLDASIKRINASCDAISKLGKIMSISITPLYRQLKIDEINLAFEYAQAKQKEKEDMKAYREQLREEAKLQKEIEEQRKKIKKEQLHYLNAIETIKTQLAEDPTNQDLLSKYNELMSNYTETEKAMKDIDYREANKKAGYVYVISNIGAFGENVYKIGMTRRLEPQERVDELSDASVPFNFDVHAMIFTQDAPGLEAALHNAFADRKVNLINHRREFFNVTLDEIKAVVKKNFDKTVEFTEIPDAEQYRMTLDIRNHTQQ